MIFRAERMTIVTIFRTGTNRRFLAAASLRFRELSPLQSQGQGSNPRRQAMTERLLPVELAFLTSYGCPAETLRLAALLPRLRGHGGSDCSQAGLVPEDVFYRALAAELGLDFNAAPRLSREARFPQSLWAGVAPLEGSAVRLVMAPQGGQIGRLLHARRPFGSRVVITSPARPRKAVFVSRAQGIARSASHQLPERRPALVEPRRDLRATDRPPVRVS